MLCLVRYVITGLSWRCRSWSSPSIAFVVCLVDEGHGGILRGDFRGVLISLLNICLVNFRLVTSNHQEQFMFFSYFSDHPDLNECTLAKWMQLFINNGLVFTCLFFANNCGLPGICFLIILMLRYIINKIPMYIFSVTFKEFFINPIKIILVYIMI